MNEKLNSSQKEAFLAGDSLMIKELGQQYLNVIGKPAMSADAIDGFVKGSPEYLAPIGEGWGMSTDDALRCLFDIKRTATFIEGVREATRVLRQRFPNEELVVIEAGCGTGILAVAIVYAGVDKVIGIEINPVTSEFTQRFVESLGLEEKIQIIQADATVYTPPSKVHLITSENMHTGLFFEPQMQIVSHLKAYLKAGGIILPQAVNLSFAVAQTNWSEIGKPQIELRKTNGAVQSVGDYSFMRTLDFLRDSEDKTLKGAVPLDGIFGNSLVIEMNVHVYDGIVLKSGEAEFLGQPHLVQVQQIKNGHSPYGFFYYQAGGTPPDKIYGF